MVIDCLRLSDVSVICRVVNPTPINMLCSNSVKFGRREIGEIVRYLPDKRRKFRLSLQLSLLRGSRPNMPGPAPEMYPECSRFHSNRFTFGGVIAERINTAKTRRKVNPISG